MVIINKYSFWKRLFSFLVGAVLLWQDTALPIDYHALTKESFFSQEAKNLHRYSERHKTQLGYTIEDTYIVYRGLENIEDALREEQKATKKSIMDIAKKDNEEFGKYISFTGNLEHKTENGRKYYYIDIDLIGNKGKKYSKRVVFYNRDNPPLEYLRRLSGGDISQEDERYIKERGFWIFNMEKLIIEEVGEKLAGQQMLHLVSMFYEKTWISTEEKEKRVLAGLERSLQRYEEDISREMEKSNRSDKDIQETIKNMRKTVRDRFTLNVKSGILLGDKNLYVLCGNYDNARILKAYIGRAARKRQIREISKQEFIDTVVETGLYWSIRNNREMSSYYKIGLEQYHQHIRFTAKERLTIFIATGINLFDIHDSYEIYDIAIKEEGQGVWDELIRDNSLIKRGLESKNLSVRLACLDLSGFLGDDSFIDIILPMIRDKDSDMAKYAIKALGRLKAKKAVPELIKLFMERYVNREPDYTEYRTGLFYSFFYALTAIGGEEAEDLFIELYKGHKNLGVRLYAVYILGELKTKKALPYIKAVLSHYRSGKITSWDYEREWKMYSEQKRMMEKAPDGYDEMSLYRRHMMMHGFGDEMGEDLPWDVIPIDRDGVRASVYALAKIGGKESWEFLKRWIEGHKLLLCHYESHYTKEDQTVGMAVACALYKLSQDSELKNDIEEKLCEWLSWDFKKEISINYNDTYSFSYSEARKCLTLAAGWIGTKKLVDKLMQLIRDPEMSRYAKKALAEVSDRDALLRFIRLIKDEEGKEREETIRAIRNCKNPVMVEALLLAMNEGHKNMETEYADLVYGLLKDMAGLNIEILMRMLEDTSIAPLARRKLVYLCGEARSRLAVKPLCGILSSDADKELSIACAEVLGIICSPLAIETLLGALDNTDVDIQLTVVEALGKIGGRIVASKVAERLEKTDPPRLKAAKIMVIAHTGDNEKITFLKPYLEDSDLDVRVNAVRAIALLGDEEEIEDINKVFSRDNKFWDEKEKGEILRQLQMKSGNIERYGPEFGEFIQELWGLFHRGKLGNVYGRTGEILEEEMKDIQQRIRDTSQKERIRPGTTPININSVTLLEDAFLFRSVRGTKACDDLVVSGFNVPEQEAGESSNFAAKSEFYSSGDPSYSAGDYLDQKGAFGAIKARFYNESLARGKIIHSDTGNWGHFVFGEPVPVSAIKYIIVSQETYRDYKYLAGLDSIEDLDINILSGERKELSKERLAVLRNALRRRDNPDYLYLMDIGELTEELFNRDILSNGLRKISFNEIKAIWQKLRNEPLFGSVFQERLVNVETTLDKTGVLRKLDDLGIEHPDVDIRIKSAILGAVVKMLKNLRKGFLRDLFSLSDSDFINARRVIEEALSPEVQQLKGVSSNHIIYKDTWAHTMAALFGPDSELEDTGGDIVYSITEPVEGLELDNINLGEGIDTRRVIRTAMLLHDLGKLDDLGPGHVQKSAIRAEKILNEAQFDEKEKDIIIHLIKTHQSWKDLSLSSRSKGEYDIDGFMKSVIEPMVLTFGTIAGEMVKLSFLIDLCDISASPESRGILSGGRYGNLWRLYEEVNKRIAPVNEAFMIGEVDKERVKAHIREKFQSLDAVRYRLDGEKLIKGVPVRREGDTDIVVDIKGNAVFSEEIVPEEDTQYKLIKDGLLLLTEKEPDAAIVFLRGENMLSFDSLDKLQFAKRSRHEDRRQVILPYNMLYLLLCIENGKSAFEYILTYERIRRNNMDASVSNVMGLTDMELDADSKKKAFFELLQLAAAVEYIAREIKVHNNKDLILSLDEDGVLRGKRTNEVEAILEIDIRQELDIRIGGEVLTYWDVLKAKLAGRKDALTEMIPRGLSLSRIRGLLINTLLRKEMIAKDIALSETNLSMIEGISAKIEQKEKISISSKLFIENVNKTGDNRFEFNQQASGIRYLLEKIQSGFFVEIINESGVSDNDLQALLSTVFNIGKTKINVINLGDAKKADYKKAILLLHEDSDTDLQDFKDRGIKVLIGKRGVSVNVLITVGIYKLLDKDVSDIKNLLVSLGYRKTQAEDIISGGLLMLPPLTSILPLINDIASFRRAIDIAA